MIDKSAQQKHKLRLVSQSIKKQQLPIQSNNNRAIQQKICNELYAVAQIINK